jgi:hypothetical protein
MTISYSPRFVHNQDIEHKKYHGVTIAYVRTDKNVFFAYALCTKADNYSKKFGRERTTETLETHIEGIPDDDEVIFSKEFRCGSISVQTMTHATNLSAVLADHKLEELTMMDFKHATISAVLGDIVNKLALDIE